MILYKKLVYEYNKALISEWISVIILWFAFILKFFFDKLYDESTVKTLVQEPEN